MHEKNQFIKNLAIKDDVDSIFLVKVISIVEGRDGRPYLNIILSDATGDLESRMWANADRVMKHVSKGDVVRAEGKVNLYQSRKQLVVTRLERLEASEVDMQTLVSAASRSPDDMLAELVALVEMSCDDFFIKQLLMKLLMDPELSEKLKQWPAGKSIHHSYQSGLLEHILSCSQLAVQLSAHYQVNVNYVVAGTVLHDLCKVDELTSGAITDYSFEGKLVGHLIGGVELVEEVSRHIPNFPHDLKVHLKHILLSHHGELAFGSPKVPQTMEAMLVHMIDMLDSRMNAMQMIRANDTNEGDWSGFVKHLDRVIFKPDLPFYPSPSASTQVSAPGKSNSGSETQSSRKKNSDAPLKQSLGKLLEGVKLNQTES